MADIATTQDIFSAFNIDTGKVPPVPDDSGGTTPPVTETTPPVTPPVTPPTGAPKVEKPAESADDVAAKEAAEKADAQVKASEKTAQAFATMRTQLKQYENTLASVAKLLKIEDLSDPSAVLAAVQDAALRSEAKSSGVPEETLKRLRALEERDTASEQERTQAKAYGQFQTVQTKFGLTPAELGAFADQLVASGRNPFLTEMDLIREYQIINQDKIIDKAKKAAIAEEQIRAAKVATQSTTPNSKQGSSGTDVTKIDSVKALSKLMDGMN